ncbi:uncharacterized protein LOC117341426 [Pecten maximus]|uniref:uncharacterized protein LOC117341426 n=1 Tax=Pecten maximus TaxID=6579 RepID=UPI001458F3DF|nr:uncharacterized protein LOC117341426 [Pecten maximus]
MYQQKKLLFVSQSDTTFLWIILLLLTVASSSDAVSLSGSSEYAVPGTEFTLTCDVPEEAIIVLFYGRPDVTTPVGSIPVGGDQCYNSQVYPRVPCTPDVCSCVTSGGLGTVFRWIIQPQTGDHGSVWYCTRTNFNLPDQTLDSDDYTLNVADGPGTSIALSPPDTTYTRTEGDTLPDITCTSDCRPGCTFVWTRPDNTNFTVSPVLSLGQLDRSEHGTYRCTARNIVEESTIITSVTVQYGPGDSIVFDPPQDSVDIIENQTISDVRCSADCRPVCIYTLSRSGTDYTNPLSLSVATRNNAGQYTCTARNTVSQGTKTWNLIVRFPPRILSLDYTDGDSYVAENGPKSLVCSVESFPPSTIQWFYKANNTVLLTTPDVLESTYTLTNADCLDTGLYTCSVRNSVSTTAVTRDIPINVLCEPRRVARNETDQKYNLATGDILVMNALFLSNPEPTFSWSFQASPGTVVTPLVDGTDNFAIHNTFVVMNLFFVSVGARTYIRETWYGVYSVTATNSQGSNTFSFIVEGKNMPKLPKSLSVSCGNPHSVELMWTNGGNTEYFRVLYSTDNFLQSVIDPATIFKQVDGNDVYSVTIDTLDGGQLYFFKVVAYNSDGNITSLESSGCRVQEDTCSPNSLYVTGVVLTCISGLMITLTFGLGIFITRKGCLPFCSSKCQQRKSQEFDNVQLSGRATITQEGERSYQELDTSQVAKASVYSEIRTQEIGGNNDNEANQSSNYESLEGRSKPNVYEELQTASSGSSALYTNTTIAKGTA